MCVDYGLHRYRHNPSLHNICYVASLGLIKMKESCFSLTPSNMSSLWKVFPARSDFISGMYPQESLLELLVPLAWWKVSW